MPRYLLMAAFVLLMAGVGWAFVSDERQPLGPDTWLAVALAVTVGTLAVCVDILAPRKKLVVFAAVVLGLFVGLVVAYALSFPVRLIVEQAVAIGPANAGQVEAAVQLAQTLVGCVSCYFAVSFVLQTRDDFRFVVPYIEFAREARGPRPAVLDTSALIDGRAVALAAAGAFEAQLLVPRFVIDELQQVADSADKLKRARGRRGLDAVARLQATPRADVRVYESSRYDDAAGTVDQKLTRLARELNARVITTDFNRNKVAAVSGVDVLNLNDWAGALRPEALPGERLRVPLVRAGETAGQGVGFLADGTMVVVEGAAGYVGDEVELSVTNVRQTTAGRMIFGRLAPPTPRAAEPEAEPDAPANDAVPPDAAPPADDPVPRERTARRRGPPGASFRPRRVEDAPRDARAT